MALASLGQRMGCADLSSLGPGLPLSTATVGVPLIHGRSGALTLGNGGLNSLERINETLRFALPQEARGIIPSRQLDAWRLALVFICVISATSRNCLSSPSQGPFWRGNLRRTPKCASRVILQGFWKETRWEHWEASSTRLGNRRVSLKIHSPSPVATVISQLLPTAGTSFLEL